MNGMIRRFSRFAGLLAVAVVILAFLWEMQNPSAEYEKAVQTFATAMENGDYETLVTVYPKIPGEPDFWHAVSGKANYFYKSYDGYSNTWKFDFTFTPSDSSPKNESLGLNNHWTLDVTEVEENQWKIVSLSPVFDAKTYYLR